MQGYKIKRSKMITGKTVRTRFKNMYLSNSQMKANFIWKMRKFIEIVLTMKKSHIKTKDAAKAALRRTFRALNTYFS